MFTYCSLKVNTFLPMPWSLWMLFHSNLIFDYWYFGFQVDDREIIYTCLESLPTANSLNLITNLSTATEHISRLLLFITITLRSESLILLQGIWIELTVFFS